MALGKGRFTSFSSARRLLLGVADRDRSVSRSISTRSGGSLAALNFPLFFPPTLISITPNNGTVFGGTVVDLAGLNFRAGATVTFGGVPATGVTFVSPSHITCTTPSHATIGSVDVKVTNTDGQFSTLVNGYSYTGIIVAVGANVAASSEDGGVTWTPRVIPAGDWKDVIWGGLSVGFVAIGDTNVSAFSRDGKTWVSGGALPNNSAWLGMAASSSRVVASGNDSVNLLASSTDGGVSWSTVSNGVAVNVAVGGTFGGGLFSFIGQSGNISSPDGTTWTEHLSGPNNSSAPGINTVVYNGSYFTALRGGNIWTSPDAATWTFHGLVLPLTGSNPVMAFQGGVFAALSASDAASSPDGFNWTSQSTGVTGVAASIVASGKTFVACFTAGSRTVVASPDGVAWTVNSNALPVGTWRALASPP